MKKIAVHIDKKSGKLTVSTEGYEGAACIEATRKLEAGLGLKEPERTLTPEYYQQTETEQQIGGA